jgi:CMP-N-acetylneuraminic acid synthetase
VLIDAVIPARGGSKRIPDKNLADLGGLPLVVHTIRFALEHPSIGHVYVSTDAERIATAARAHGAEVIDRPPALAGDHATTSAAVQHALACIERDHPVDAIATLQPTSPLRLPAWLDDCAATLTDPRFESAVTVSPVTSKVGTIEDGAFQPQYRLETRSQDEEPRFRENGLIYLTRAQTIAAGSVFGSTIGAVITDHVYATIDIDTRADLDYAAAVMGGVT